jgi:hypothetical protein
LSNGEFTVDPLETMGKRPTPRKQRLWLLARPGWRRLFLLQVRRLSNLSLIVYSIWFWQDISNLCSRRSPHFRSLASISNLLLDGTNAGECSSTSYGIFLPPIIPRDERSTDPTDLGCTSQTVWWSPPTSRGSLGNISRVAWLMLGTCTDQKRDLFDTRPAKLIGKFAKGLKLQT